MIPPEYLTPQAITMLILGVCIGTIIGAWVAYKLIEGDRE
jgi:hypothetical protein